MLSGFPSWEATEMHEGDTMSASDKQDKPAPKAAPAPPVLGDAGGSTDPLVQQALAQLEIAERNRDALNVDPADIKAADAAVKAAKAALADLGVES